MIDALPSVSITFKLVRGEAFQLGADSLGTTSPLIKLTPLAGVEAATLDPRLVWFTGSFRTLPGEYCTLTRLHQELSGYPMTGVHAAAKSYFIAAADADGAKFARVANDDVVAVRWHRLVEALDVVINGGTVPRNLAAACFNVLWRNVDVAFVSFLERRVDDAYRR